MTTTTRPTTDHRNHDADQCELHDGWEQYCERKGGTRGHSYDDCCGGYNGGRYDAHNGCDPVCEGCGYSFSEITGYRDFGDYLEGMAEGEGPRW